MGAGDQYDIAYIIVTFNSGADIRKCLESIGVHRLGAEWKQTTIVVDNASTDATANVLDLLRCEDADLKVILLDRNVGFGAANNAGFASAPAKYYVLLNADAWLISDSLTTAFAAMEANPHAAVCGLPLVFPDGSPQTYAYRSSSWKKWLLQLMGVRKLAGRLVRIPAVATILERSRLSREYVRSLKRPRVDLDRIEARDFSGAARTVDWVCGAAMIVRGDFVRESGGFDPAIFLYGEDEDLCIEARRRGHTVIAVDAPPVVHKFGWETNRFDAHLADLKYRSLRYFIAKNANGPVNRLLMRIVLPFHVYGWFSFWRAWQHGKR